MKKNNTKINKLNSKKLWAFRLISLTIVPFIFFIILELSLRLIGYGYNTDFINIEKRNNEKYYRENKKFAWRFFPHKITTPRNLQPKAKAELDKIMR